MKPALLLLAAFWLAGAQAIPDRVDPVTGASPEPTCEQRILALQAQVARLQASMAEIEGIVYSTGAAVQLTSRRADTIAELSLETQRRQNDLRRAQNENAGQAQIAVADAKTQSTFQITSTICGFASVLFGLGVKAYTDYQARALAARATAEHRKAELEKLASLATASGAPGAPLNS
jgi:hypothetical protein